MKIERNRLIIGGVAIGILLLLGVVMISGRGGSKSNDKTEELLPTEVVIPTVDESVKVDLVVSSAGREVVLQIKSIPTGTESIDYELSYQTKQQGLQGVIGTVELTKQESEVDKTLTLGTCSSGTCIYHQVVGNIKLNLKFNGDYGEKVFDKEYEI